MSLRLVSLTGCCLVAIAAAAPVRAQQLGGGGGVDIPFWRVLAALVISAAAAITLALVLRARAGAGSVRFKWLAKMARGGRIRLVENRRIASQAELSVVRCDAVEYVVLTGQGHAQIVERREIPADEAPLEP